MIKVARNRKSMAGIAQFIDRIELDAIENQESLIAKARQLQPFGPVDWHSSRWDVTAAVQHKVRGHEVSQKKFLKFTLDVGADKSAKRNKLPLEGRLADIIKALVGLRFNRGGQTAQNQQHFIDGWRFVYDALEYKSHRLEMLTTEDLDVACKTARDRLGESTAYNVHKAIHEIADLIDINRLAKISLSYRYAALKRVDATSGAGFSRLDSEDAWSSTSSEKMVGEDVLAALGQLYQIIPRNEWIDRVRILLVTISIFLGRRIGETLSLPAKPVQFTEKGSAFLEYFPEKHALGDAVVPMDKVRIATKAVDLVNACIDELLELTKQIRGVAEFIHEHRHADYRVLGDYSSRELITPGELCRLLGLSSQSNASTWAKSRGAIAFSNPNHHNPRAICFSVEGVKSALDLDVNSKPVLIACGKNYFLKDLLVIMPVNGAQRDRASLFHAVEQINYQHMSDFLGSNESRKKVNERGGCVTSCFQRYLGEERARDMGCNTHAFRHTLNTWLDEGGMSDAAQTKWFGRKSASDTRAYQHMSPEKAALLVQRDLIDGKIKGPLADRIKTQTIEVKEAVVKAMVRSVLDVGPGLCFHDFSQIPCERFLQCTTNCKDYHWRSDDSGRKEDVKRQYSLTMNTWTQAQEPNQIGRGKSAEWVIQQEIKLGVLRRQMEDLSIEEFDWKAHLLELSA